MLPTGVDWRTSHRFRATHIKLQYPDTACKGLRKEGFSAAFYPEDVKSFLTRSFLGRMTGCDALMVLYCYALLNTFM